MLIIRKILAGIIFFFFAGTFFSAAAKDSDTLSPLISYKHFGEEDGLHCKTIYEAIQDKNGFMWFATDAGAFRFDGKNFRQYNIENGVTDKEVLKIFQDSYGRIWFLTMNGHLSFWKDDKIYNPSNTPFLKKAYSGGSIYSYFEDSKRRIWLGTSLFVYIIIDNDSVRLIKCPYEGDLGSYAIHEDAHGDMWTFSRDKMFRFPDNLIGDTVRCPELFYFICHGKKRGEIFCLNFTGNVYKISDTTVSVNIDKKEIPPDSKIVNIISDEETFWICTMGSGCIRIVNGKFYRTYLENAAIASVYRDRENNLWFNTMGEGVYMLPSSADFVKNYNRESGLSGNNITSFALGIQGEFWLGYKNGMVEKIKDNKVTNFEQNRIRSSNFNRVNSLVCDSDVIFSGTDIGVFSIDNNGINYVPLAEPFSGNDYSAKQLFVSKERNIYVTHASGLHQLVKSNNNYFAKSIITYTRTFAVVQYPGTHLLVSVAKGLVECIPGQEIADYETDIDFSSIRILDMKEVPADMLMLATNGNGIYFLKNKKLYQHLSAANDLSDNNCKRIFVSNNTVYVATDKGLNILVKENQQWKVSEVITTQNGLLSNTVSDAAERNGVIYVATDKGLSIFNRSIIPPEKFVGKVYVTEIVTDSAYTVTDSAYSFKADISRLFIRFAYPVFSPANNLKVSYRLLRGKSDNAEWIHSESNEVEFSSLNPGQYIFQLKPDALSVSEAGITNLYIRIIPLWWQTTVARIAFALVIVGLIFIILRRRIQMQYQKQVAELRHLSMLEAERNRIASDMHDDIGADLTQISIWSNILNSSGNKDTSVISRITKSSNGVLQKMDQIIWALNSFQNHTADLISYLREYASQYLDSAGIRLLFEADEALPDIELSAILKRNIFLTVKELLHNTVKHSEAQNVRIRIYHADSVLHIEYMDDGKGFTPKPKEDGLGNITVQKRMREINSTISVKTSPGEGFSAHLKISGVPENGLKKSKRNFTANYD